MPNPTQLSKLLVSGWILGILGIASGLLIISADFDSGVSVSILGPLPYLFGGSAIAVALVELIRTRSIKPAVGVIGVGLGAIAVVPLFWAFVIAMVVVALIAALLEGAN